MKTSIKCKTNWFLAVLTSFGLVLDRFFEKLVATTLDQSFSGPGTIPRLPKAVQSGFLPKKAKKLDWTRLLNSIDEEIYMEQPNGFAAPGQDCKVLCLWHALYGLKQAGLAWWRTLDESLKELGFEHLKSEAGFFFYKKKGTNVVGIIYVDDALFCGPNKAVVDSIKAQFMCKWECCDLGEPKEFL